MVKKFVSEEFADLNIELIQRLIEHHSDKNMSKTDKFVACIRDADIFDLRRYPDMVIDTNEYTYLKC